MDAIIQSVTLIMACVRQAILHESMIDVNPIEKKLCLSLHCCIQNCKRDSSEIKIIAISVCACMYGYVLYKDVCMHVQPHTATRLCIHHRSDMHSTAATSSL